MEHYFHERKMDKLWLFRQVFDRLFSKINNIHLSLPGKQGQLLPMIIFELPRENWKFRRCVSTARSWLAYQYLVFYYEIKWEFGKSVMRGLLLNPWEKGDCLSLWCMHNWMELFVKIYQ